MTMREGHAPGATAADRDRLAQARGQSDAMRALSYLLSGVILYGGLGWLGDRWFGTAWLLPLGLVLGAGLGIYTVIRRFAALDGASDTSDLEATTEKERR